MKSQTSGQSLKGLGMPSLELGIVNSLGDSFLICQECTQEGRIHFPFISDSRRIGSILGFSGGNTRPSSELQGK